MALTREEQNMLRLFRAGRVRIVLPEPTVEVVKEQPVNTFYQDVIAGRIPCAYGSASCAGKRFAPGGVGSRQHTTCGKGRKAMQAARA